MIRPLLVSLRPLQWAKNLFVLAPLVFGHLLGDPDAVGRALLALAAFCCAASTIYLLNDIRDREEDRNHPLKRLRPLAAGTLAVPVAAVAAAVLGPSALAIAFFLGRGFLTALSVYLALNFLYTPWF